MMWIVVFDNSIELGFDISLLTITVWNIQIKRWIHQM